MSNLQSRDAQAQETAALQVLGTLASYSYVMRWCDVLLKGEHMALGQWLLLALFLCTPTWSRIISKSSVSRCLASGEDGLQNSAGENCTKKVVIAMSITANEVK